MHTHSLLPVFYRLHFSWSKGQRLNTSVAKHVFWSCNFLWVKQLSFVNAKWTGNSVSRHQKYWYIVLVIHNLSQISCKVCSRRWIIACHQNCRFLFFWVGEDSQGERPCRLLLVFAFEDALGFVLAWQENQMASIQFSSQQYTIQQAFNQVIMTPGHGNFWLCGKFCADTNKKKQCRTDHVPCCT